MVKNSTIFAKGRGPMMIIEVCVGSSCHLKGSYEVIETFDRLISQNQLTDEVELRGVFCLEHCTQGVTVRIGHQICSVKSPQNVADLFKEMIKPLLRGDGCADHCHQPEQL